MKHLLFLICSLHTMLLVGQHNEFDLLNKSDKWTLKFKTSDTKNWKDQWFLDGERATVKNTETGLSFKAGPTERDDACHAVLWTKPSFEGEVKIEYEYTRTDTKQKWVNILYIQATGSAPYPEDIYQWRHQRTVPAMKIYFKNMQLLHISYAAFNNNTGEEYIRARRYPVMEGESFNPSTEIPPAIFKTGLFEPYQTYKITAIKTENTLYFKVEGEYKSKLFSWDISKISPTKKGRIGLRHMFTRSARYSNFKVYTK